jgi:hypothetical protein
MINNPLSGIQTPLITYTALVGKFFKEHLPKISADSMEWLAIIVMHCATIPTMMALMAGLTDRMPSLDMVLFIWAALLLMFVRAILLKNSFNIISNGLGFVSQAVVMAFILFK